MTLILLCYMCGQGEKIRLTMRGLIIAVTTYIAVFSFGVASNQVYALDIGILPGTSEVTVMADTDSGNNYSSSITIQHGLSMDPYSVPDISEPRDHEHHTSYTSNIDMYMEELFALESSFPAHPAFQGNNKTVLNYIASKLTSTSLQKQMSFLGRLIEVFGDMSEIQQQRYGIDTGTLVPLLQFMVIKGEMTPVKTPIASAKPPSHSGTLPGIFSKFELSSHMEGLTTFRMKENMGVGRLNIYVNEKFIKSCEGGQCNTFSLEASQGDTIHIYYTGSNFENFRDEYTLGVVPTHYVSKVYSSSPKGPSEKESTHAHDKDGFAQCLQEKGFVMYGTEWCSHCQKQKELFGDAFSHITYVDCDTDRDQCVAAGVQGFPTWMDSSFEIFPGSKTFNELEKLSGCKYQ